MQLNIRQQRFCDEIVKGQKTQAECYEVVYGKRPNKALARQSASKLMARPNIKKEIKDLQEDLAERTDTHKSYIVSNLKRVVTQSMAAEPILDHKGNETGVFKFNGSSAVSALNQLSKMLGHDKPNPTYYQEEITTVAQAKMAISNAMMLLSRAEITINQFDAIVNGSRTIQELIKINEIQEEIQEIKDKLS